MTDTIKRKQPNARPSERQFIAPFPLEESRARLQAESEKPAFWGSVMQPRIEVDTWVMDENTVGFRVSAVGNGLFSIYPLAKSTRAYGTLARQADATTHVWVDAGTARVVYLPWVLLLGVSLVALTMLMRSVPLVACILGYVLITVVLMSLPHLRRWYRQQHTNLLVVVETALVAHYPTEGASDYYVTQQRRSVSRG
jgi:hypothetical protein